MKRGGERIQEILRQMGDKPLERALAFSAEAIDADKRTVELSFSSEAPVSRWFGQEILDHQLESVRLDRLNNGAPSLWDHNPSDQRGVVEKAWLDGARGRAVIRFGRSVKSSELFADVEDGVVRNISIIYRVHKLVLEKEEDGQEPVYRATDWEPYSIDFVAMPADASVGVGRSAQVTGKQEERDMEKCQICGQEFVDGRCPDGCLEKARTAMAAKPADVEGVRVEAQKGEQARVAAILAVSEQHDCPELGRKHIEAGTSKEDYAGIVLEEKYHAKPIQNPDPRIGASEKECKQYSFQKAINASLEGNWKGAGLEREMSEAVAQATGRQPQSFFVPYDILVAKRDVFDTSGSAGAGAIATNLLAGSFIEALQNRTLVMQLGATTLPGLVGDVAIPKQTGTVTAQWKAESSAADRSRPKIEQLTMTPKTITAYSDLSRKLLKQSALAVEAFVQEDLAKSVRLAIDLAAINGAGSATEPEGILKTSGIGAVLSAGTLTWGHCIDLWSAVAGDNADFGTLAYLTNAYVVGQLLKTEKATGTAKFVIEEFPDNAGMTRIGAVRCGVSNQVPKTIDSDKTALLFGNFADLIIGLWGGLDVLVDPYSGSTTGAVRIVVHQDIDTLVRHAESFAAAQDIDT